MERAGRATRLRRGCGAPSIEGKATRVGAVPELADRVLRVIVSKTEPKRVITVHVDRKMKDKL